MSGAQYRVHVEDGAAADTNELPARRLPEGDPGSAELEAGGAAVGEEPLATHLEVAEKKGSAGAAEPERDGDDGIVFEAGARFYETLGPIGLAFPLVFAGVAAILFGLAGNAVSLYALSANRRSASRRPTGATLRFTSSPRARGRPGTGALFFFRSPRPPLPSGRGAPRAGRSGGGGS